MTILVIAMESDLHADAVVDHLSKRGAQIIRIDPTDDISLPQKVHISSASGFHALYEFKNGETVDSTCVNGVFCRFAIESLIPKNSVDALKRFSESEQIAAFLAPLRMIDPKKWINDPWTESRIDCRVFQSYIARSLGFKVPELLVSNRYNDLLSFYNKFSDVIIKPLSDSPLAKVENSFIIPEKLFTNNFYSPYATEFTPIKQEDNLEIDETPTLLQVKIFKKADIRATIIDDKVFAAEIPYTTGDSIDFRRHPNKEIKQIELSDTIKEMLINLILKLGIRFASCDLVLNDHDELFFLEANPEGNWLWTESNCHLSISEALATALMN